MKTLKYLFSSILSPLPTGEGLGVRLLGVRLHCLIVILFLFSCSRDDARQAPGDSVTTGRTIRREVTLQTVPMQPAQGAGITRATGDVVPLNEDESKIHSLTVLQFGGKDAGTLIKQTQVDVSKINATTGAFFFDFEELADGGNITVYLLANVDASNLAGITEGTTLDAFEASHLSVTALTEETMKANGLPMIASQSFDYTTGNPAPFALKNLLAKVSFQYGTIGYTYANVNLSARNLATAVPVRESAAGTSVQHPAGIDYTGSLALVDDFTYSGTETVCYLPENLAGQVAAITKDSERGGDNVPQGATYMSMNNVDLGGTRYSFYLGDGTPSDFNVQRNHQYTLTAKLRGVNAGDRRVKCETANCYIVTTAGTYSFDATKAGNDSNVSGITKPTNFGTATTARVIWQTGSSATDLVIDLASVKFEAGKVFFTTGTETEGNAVIGIFADSNEGAACLWSWHIWRLNGSAPGTVSCTKILASSSAETTYTMMDRNLGAFNNTPGDPGSKGLLYQWGRKDPFPGSDGWTNDEPSNIYNNVYMDGMILGYGYGKYDLPKTQGSIGYGVDYGIEWPGVFIYQGSNNDWTYPKNDNLWGTPWTTPGYDGYNANVGTKSIYDPCPMGYRVPPQDFANKAVSGSWNNGNAFMGIVASGSLWFPAAGYRNGSSSGVLLDASSYGHYWSSSPSYGTSNYGGSLNFNSDIVNARGSSVRAKGASVRCVSVQSVQSDL
ncbi:DUF4906 domain-containing protein [Bacteroides sp.]